MFPQNSAVKKDRAGLSQSTRGELPFKWGEEPRPAKDPAGFDAADDDSAVARANGGFELNHAFFDQVKAIRGLALMKDDLACIEMSPAGTTREHSDVAIVHPGKKGNCGDVARQIVRGHLPFSEVMIPSIRSDAEDGRSFFRKHPMDDKSKDREHGGGCEYDEIVHCCIIAG